MFNFQDLHSPLSAPQLPCAATILRKMHFMRVIEKENEKRITKKMHHLLSCWRLKKASGQWNCSNDIYVNFCTAIFLCSVLIFSWEKMQSFSFLTCDAFVHLTKTLQNLHIMCEKLHSERMTKSFPSSFFWAYFVLFEKLQIALHSLCSCCHIILTHLNRKKSNIILMWHPIFADLLYTGNKRLCGVLPALCEL